MCDAGGIPLAVSLTGGNRNDVTQLLPLVDAIPPIRGLVGRPRRRPGQLLADRGYDYDVYRRQQVTPEQPTNEVGSWFQVIPVLSTNTIPARAARSLIGRRPG